MKKKEEVPPASAPAAQQPPVAAAKETALQTIPDGGELQKSAFNDMLAEDAGAGLGNMGANDFAIPFISILQKGSPQVSRANAKFIDGTAPGDIMNTVTQEIYDGREGILFIPCGYMKSIVRWKSRDSGGGLVSHHKEGDPILRTLKRNERGQLVHEESGDVFIDTAYHFGLLLHGEAPPEWAVVSMYSTQLKKSRMWNTTMRRIVMRGSQGSFNPPSFSHQYRMTTVGETKDTYDWFGWKVAVESQVSDLDVYKMAREFSKQVEEGNVRISAPPQVFEEEEGAKEEVPF